MKVSRQPLSMTVIRSYTLRIAVLFLGTGLSPRLRAETGPALPGVAQINPAAIAYSQATGKVYAVDKVRNSVTISDDAAGKTKSVKVGAGPVSIAVNPTSGKAYVVNADEGTVSVLDGRNDTVLATLKVGAHPYSIALNSSTGEVYVSRTYSDEVMTIDGTTDTVKGIKAGSMDAIAVDAKRGVAYLVGYERDQIGELSETSHVVRKHFAGMHLWGIAVDEATGNVYVTRPQDREVMVLAPESDAVAIPAGEMPTAVAVNSMTNKVYVSNYVDNTVTVIDGGSRRVIATVPVGSRPEAIAVDTQNGRVYVANTQSDSVSVIDGGSNLVLATLPAGKKPYALAINPKAGVLHVANLDEHATTTIDVRHAL